MISFHLAITGSTRGEELPRNMINNRRKRVMWSFAHLSVAVFLTDTSQGTPRSPPTPLNECKCHWTSMCGSVLGHLVSPVEGGLDHLSG